MNNNNNNNTSSPLSRRRPSASSACCCFAHSHTKRIIDLNNTGAKLLATSGGNPAAALSFFSEALNVSKACIANRRALNRKRKIRQKRRDNHREEKELYEERCLPLDIDCLMEAGRFGLVLDREDGDSDDSNSSDSSMSFSFDDFSSSFSSASSDAAAIAHSKKESNEHRLGGENIPSYASAIGAVVTPQDDRGCGDDDGGDGDFVYDTPIYIDGFYTRPSGLRRSESVLPSIIIFNSALANHLMAIEVMETKRRNGEEEGDDEVPPSAKECLRNATRLYKLSVELQRHGSRRQRAHGRLFFLSCVNNLGSAYGLLGDKKSEERTHKKLLTTLMYLSYRQRLRQGQESRETPQHYNHNARAPTRTQHKYESFFRNLFKKETSNTASAA